MLAPPGASISSYDRSAPYTSQAGTIPSIFLDAMSIREEVFVREQKCVLEHELDSDDARSWHWVTFASVGAPKASSSSSSSSTQDKMGGSTARRVPVGTVRLVPPPHPPHPEPGSQHQMDNSEGINLMSLEDKEASPGPSSQNPDNEPYIKIGRLATLAPYRRLGLGRMLLDTALTWAAKNPEHILPPPSAASREAARIEGRVDVDDVYEAWRGLVLIHAQTNLQKWYAKFGFTLDEKMGQWDEEGIAHVGMWKRIKVKER